MALARRDEKSKSRAFFDWHFGSLGSALLGDLPLKNVKRLIVVPHGALNFVPFAALRLNESYLVERFPVSIELRFAITRANATANRAIVASHGQA